MTNMFPTPTIHTIAFVVTTSLLAIGCDISFEETLSEESDPPYQNLDGGDQWPEDTADEDSDDTEAFDPAVLDYGNDAGTDTSEDDAGDCLNIGWEGYQVSGSCPDLPSTGQVLQDEGCSITIPGELGSVIGDNGTVEGAYVTTESCEGLAEIDDFPTVSLTCLVDDASCEVDLSGGTSGW